MRSTMLTTALAGAVCLALAIAAPDALATNPTVLWVEHQVTFTIVGGTNEFIDPTSGAAFKCKGEKGSGNLISEKALRAIVTFEKCAVGGLSYQTLGGETGQITFAKMLGQICYINAEKLQVGVVFSLPAEGVHVEQPALGELFLFSGSFVGLLDPVNTASAVLAVSTSGHRCEGASESEENLLLELEHSGSPLVENLVSEQTLTFPGSVEVMA